VSELSGRICLAEDERVSCLVDDAIVVFRSIEDAMADRSPIEAYAYAPGKVAARYGEIKVTPLTRKELRKIVKSLFGIELK
jgi:hypothetical protein